MPSGQRALWLLLLPLAACTAAIDMRPGVTHISDDDTGLTATLITIPADDNRGFAIIDVPKETPGDTVLTFWNPDTHAFIINGGYFEDDFSPTGYCKVDDRVVGPTPAEKLSGFLAIDAKGTLSLLTRSDDHASYPTVLQSGPYVIDPGGVMGIHTPSGHPAKRTLVGLTKERDVVILITEPILLYDLARAVKKKLPHIERLLNLDGGPSTALKTKDEEVLNEWPVRNYLVKTAENLNHE